MAKNNQNKQIRVGFDLDGTIISNFKIKLTVAKSLGINLLPAQTPAELIIQHFPPELYAQFQSIVYDSKKSLAPVLMRGISGVLANLKKRSIPFYLISRRKSPDMAVKIMQKYKLWPRYFNEKNSFFVARPEDKDKKAVQLGITHFIDDEIKIINALVQVPNKFLFDQFGVFSDAEHYIKIRSWAEFKKHLNL